MSVIEIDHLSKEFRVGFWKARTVHALRDLSLRVEKGEVFGFLGPNGAGKTTTLKILLNLIRPTSGSARILGEAVQSVAMRRKIGYLPENPYFYEYLTAEELLTYAGSLFGIQGPALGRKTLDLLERVGLVHARKLQLRKFSKGMVQRIGIAQAIINDPEVVFLDEPMSGLDPLGRREVRDVIGQLKTQGVTVFFSSHILPDVEALCDRVAIMKKGQLQEVGALSRILRLDSEAREIILSGSSGDLWDELNRCCEQVARMGDRLHVRARSSRDVHAVIGRALAHNAEVISVNPITLSLEDYFFQGINEIPL